MGLSFSVDPAVRPIPRSLVNIYRELHDDLGLTPPDSGDLTPWCDQGVMLLNRVLTVEPGKPASHRGKGWEAITGHAIRRMGTVFPIDTYGIAIEGIIYQLRVVEFLQ